MKKENKKLTSRQDILEGLWLERWAVFNWWKVSKIKKMPFSLMLEFEEPNGVFKYRETNIYEILYSLESNFFEVMFDDWLDKEKTREKRWIPTYAQIVKRETVLSSDPLQYLIDNQPETLGSM